LGGVWGGCWCGFLFVVFCFGGFLVLGGAPLFPPFVLASLRLFFLPPSDVVVKGGRRGGQFPLCVRFFFLLFRSLLPFFRMEK